MGIREFIEKRKQAVSIVLTVLIIGCLGYIFYSLTVGSRPPVFNVRAYYTNDEGETWFADEFAKPIPFDKDGKPAYSAIVARCGSGSEPKVVYMTRLDKDRLQVANETYAKRDENWPMRFQALQRDGLEVKLPGTDKWYPVESKAGQKIIDDGNTCPDGSPAEILVP